MVLPYRSDNVYRPGKSEHNPAGLEERTVTEAGMKELSITAFPVYEGTTAGVRSVTDDILWMQYGDIIPRVGARRDPAGLLQVLRSELQEEQEEAAPEHPEPAESAAPEQTPEEPAEETQEPEEKEEPGEPEPDLVEAGRATQPKPKKDWLSAEEARPEWRIP